MAIQGGPRMEQAGSLELSIDPASAKSFKGKKFPNSTYHVRNWGIDSGSESGYSQNGSTAENVRALGEDPWGNQSVIWTTYPDSTSGADGGWVHSRQTFDTSKMYRYCGWVKRTVYVDGRYYLGFYNYNSGGSNITSIRRTTGATSTNNYPYVSSDPPTTSQFPDSEWVLMCYHIWPIGSGTGANHADSGRWTREDGRFGGISYDVVLNASATQFAARTYLYYSTNTTPRQHWCYPRLDVVDGTEPSMQDLLDGNERALYNTHDTSTVGAYVLSDALWSSEGGGSYIMGGQTAISAPSVLNSEAIGASTTKTISFWFNCDSLGSRMAFSTGQTGSDRIYMWTENNKHTWRVGNYTDTTDHSTLTTGRWYYTTLVIDGNNIRVYLNGDLDYTGTYTSFTTHDHAVWGRHGNEALYAFDGYIGMAQIWDKVLTGYEIKQMYNRQKRRYR